MAAEDQLIRTTCYSEPETILSEDLTVTAQGSTRCFEEGWSAPLSAFKYP